ncbi:MAG: hypothetical protein IJM34_07135 [Lachnospiraceae bacterium]|nr:hypothetical protein [Lachnospiraceae bacterium]
MSKYTEAQARAIKKYLEGQAEIKLRMMPVIKNKIKDHAEQQGQSINAYILDAVDIQMAKEDNGEEIPDFIIGKSIEWLKDHGHSDSEVLDFLQYVSHEDK